MDCCQSIVELVQGLNLFFNIHGKIGLSYFQDQNRYINSSNQKVRKFAKIFWQVYISTCISNVCKQRKCDLCGEFYADTGKTFSNLNKTFNTIKQCRCFVLDNLFMFKTF